MADIILFEDNPKFVEFVERQVTFGDQHKIVEHEATIQGAFKILRQMFEGEVSADFLVVDGTLHDERTVNPEAEAPVFVYEHEELTLVRHGLFLLKKKSLLLSKTTVFEPDPDQFQSHARVIVDIMRKTGMADTTTLLGFSADPMFDVAVDHDILDKSALNLRKVLDTYKPPKIEQ